MLEPIRVPLSEHSEAELKRHLRDRIEALRQGLKPLFETNLVKWRRIYEAQPAEKTRDFPFQNASNLVVPLAGIHCDTLLARVMSAVWKTRPPWVVRITGMHRGEADSVREAWEDFLQYMGVEPTELDAMRVEEEWHGETIRYGTSTVKVPYEKEFEDLIIPAGDGSAKFDIFRDVSYRGPRPVKLCFEDFLIPPSAKTQESADIRVHRIRYQKHELLERRFTQFYEHKKVDEILKHPDRTSPEYIQQQREQDANAKTSSGYGFAEWDVHECWLKWRPPGGDNKAPRIIAWYHFKTDTLLRAFYDFYTPVLGMNPFVTERLLYRDDSFHGYGLCEVLEMLQEEVSIIHNQRRDNQTVANTKVWRVDPLSKLHQGYQIYPSAMLPAEKDEIEPLAHGEVSAVTMDEERLSLELAERRSGVSPPMQGFGAGTAVGKRGVYTAMGTLSLLQEGNRRTDLTISDIRYAHTKLGRILSREYAFFGIDEQKLVQFGEQADLIKQAAEFIKKGRLGLPVYSSTASVNKEVEKQNDLMLTQIMTRHHSMIAQLLQAATTSVLPPAMREHAVEVIKASNRLMKSILKNFDRDDVDALVPEPLTKGAPQLVANRPALQTPQPGLEGAGAPGLPPVAGLPGGVGEGRPA